METALTLITVGLYSAGIFGGAGLAAYIADRWGNKW